MKESRDMHELMIEYLYGELDDRQAEAFRKSLAERPDLAAELASLQRTREAVHGLPELDPSPAVTTRLLHAAAKQAEARAAQEAGGVFGWIADFFRPLVAHPAWAAVGALVLIVGSAALLSRQGGVSEKAEVATTRAPASAAPLEEKARTVVDTPAGPTLADPPAIAPLDQVATDKEAETGKAEEDGNKDVRRGRATTEAEEQVLGGTYRNGQRGAASGPSAEPAKKAAKNADLDDGRDSENEEGRAPAAGDKAAPELKQEYVATPPAAPPPPPADRPAMDNYSDRKANVGEQNRREQAGKADLSKSKEKSGYTGADDEIQASPRPAPAKPVVSAPAQQKPSTTSPGRGTAGGEAAVAKPEPRPLEEATPQGQVAAGAPEPTSLDAGSSRQQVQTKGGKEPTVQALHQQARQRVASRRCGDALAITREISRRDAQYYKRAVVGDRSAICEDAERAKQQRAQPKSPARDTMEELPSDNVKAK